MSKFAVIKTGGKQYLVSAGDVLRVEKLEAVAGDEIKFEPLLVAEDSGAEVKLGQPVVKGAAVVATVVKQLRAKKVTVIKFKSKARYKRKAGHRQPQTEIKIVEIK